MAQTKRIISLTICFVLIVVLGPAISATSSDSNELVGLWELDVAGGSPPVLLTFHKGGTFTGSAPIAAFSGLHGIWKKEGPRAFAARHLAYSYNEEGNVELRFEVTSVFEVSPDGQSFSVEFQTELRLPDGTLLPLPPAVFSTGTRVNL